MNDVKGIEYYWWNISEYTNIPGILKCKVKSSILNILLVLGPLSFPINSYSNSYSLEMTVEDKEKCDKKMDVLKDSLSELAEQITEILDLEEKIVSKKKKFDITIWGIVLKDNDAVHFATYYTAFVKDTRFLKKKYTEKDVDLCIEYFISWLNKEDNKNISKDLTVSELAVKIKTLLKADKFKIYLKVKK